MVGFKLQMVMPVSLVHKYGASYSAVIYRCSIYLRVNAVEYPLPLYLSWCCSSQDVAVSYAKQAVNLVDKKELTMQILGASSCITPSFPIYDPELPLDVTVRMEISLKLISDNGHGSRSNQCTLLY